MNEKLYKPLSCATQGKKSSAAACSGNWKPAVKMVPFFLFFNLRPRDERLIRLYYNLSCQEAGCKGCHRENRTDGT